MAEPALRASDDDRDLVLQALERHHVAGRLDLDEFDRRSTAALTSVTLDDLAVLTVDLPALTREPALPVEPVEPASHARHLALIFLIAFVTVAALVALMLVHP